MALRKISKTSTIALIITAIALTASTFGAISVNQFLNSSGSISTSANVGVYSDATCTTPLTAIAWGTTNPGDSVSRTIYVKNTGSGVSLTLSISTSNWSPANANGPITVSWDKTGTVLTPGQSVAAVVTLHVSSTITGITSFTFQINIAGTG